MNLRHNPPVQSGLWSICRCIWAVALSCIFSDVAVMNLWSKQLAVVMIMRDSWESLSLPPTSLPLVRGSTLLLCFCLPVILCRTCSHLIPFAMCAHALQHVTPGYVMCLSSSESRSSSFSRRGKKGSSMCVDVGALMEMQGFVLIFFPWSSGLNLIFITRAQQGCCCLF